RVEARQKAVRGARVGSVLGEESALPSGQTARPILTEHRGPGTEPCPEGTITFLFTDIEGSTRLWEEHAEAMREALVRHDALLRHAIRSHGGHVFKTFGDQFCAAFVRATEALAAALAAQRALQAEGHRRAERGGPNDAGALRVRMALHTGAAE